MRFRPVQAVWFWRYSTSAFKATYGRFPATTDSSYTKDFLQTSGSCRQAMLDALGIVGGSVDLTYRWPGGSAQGQFYEGTDRHELAWRFGDPPPPWKLFPDGDDSPLKTFPGDPSHTTPAAANTELANFEARNLDPWLVVVKLWNEPATLHLRAYLGNPPPDLAHTSTTNLPKQVQDAMAAVPGNHSCGVHKFAELPGVRADALVRSILDSLQHGPNVLLTGPPGTGKTVAMEDLRQLSENDEWVLFDPELFHDCWNTTDKRRARSAVFHSSYSYEDLVVGLLPEPAPGGGVKLVAHPGPLIELSHWTSRPTHIGLLSTDEFNRGNAAGIFGDMLALLDEDKRADVASGRPPAQVDRPYPALPLNVPANFKVNGGTVVADPLTLSTNLITVAALNSSDRSVAPIDAALRRRFAMLHVGPDYDVLARRIGLAAPTDFRAVTDPLTWNLDDARRLAISLLRKLNERIEAILGADYLLGHALLWTVEGDTPEAVATSLAKAFDERVASTLRMTFAEQDELLSGVLGAGPPPTSPPTPDARALASWTLPPSGLETLAMPRLRVASAQSLKWPLNAIALRGLLQ